tara:strand:- start:217 stop:1062 length:846 start_codon:yes stop_codon:yes gene_type:complete
MAKEHKQAVIAQKAIFTTGSMRLSRVVPSILIAILILTTDVRFNVGEKIKIYVGFATEPIIFIPKFVKEGWISFSDYFEDREILQKEILRLEKEFDAQRFNLLNYEKILQENLELKRLLGYLEQTTKKNYIYGEIEEINYAPKPSMTVGIPRNQKADQMIAFNWTGLIGSVELSAGSKVEIKPIFSKDSQIPIRNRRTNSNMILVGTDVPQSFLIKGLKKNEDIIPGDKLVTSGLGKKYPKAIDIGIVNKISETSNNEFLEIEVLGTAEFNSGDQILLTLP